MFDRAELGFKRHFISNSFHSTVPRSLRKQVLNKVKCHIRVEGVKKVPKKCHVLFEWPLTGVLKIASVNFL